MKQIFLQSELLDDIVAVAVDEHASPRAIRQACMAHIVEVLLAEELFLFLEDDDEEDALLKLECVIENMRVHLHRLKEITVKVRYAGREAVHTFRPGATVVRVKKWAAHEFGIPPSDAAELMLQISGSDKRPDSDVHLGSLVKKPEHSLCFDLVPAPRVNG